MKFKEIIALKSFGGIGDARRVYSQLELMKNERRPLDNPEGIA